MQRPRYLMCPPDYFGVHYVINPWMEGHIDGTTSAVATAQWNELYRLLALHTEVVLLTPVTGLPDLVFTANAAVIKGKTAVLSSFLHKQRQAEEPHLETWLTADGFKVHILPRDLHFEGAGDALFDHGQPLLWFGHGIRSSERAVAHLEALLQIEVQPLTLLQSRFYHLDTCFCPLERGYLLYYPRAFDDASNQIIEARVPAHQRLAVSEEDASNFACNAINIGDQVILHLASEPLKQWLAARGFCVLETPTTEFLLAGGSAKCLSLNLCQT